MVLRALVARQGSAKVNVIHDIVVCVHSCNKLVWRR